jgi:hypothetical protein
MPRPGRFTPGKETRYPLYRRLDGWAPGQVWTGVENLTLTGIRPPHRPVRSCPCPPLDDLAVHVERTKWPRGWHVLLMTYTLLGGYETAWALQQVKGAYLCVCAIQSRVMKGTLAGMWSAPLATQDAAPQRSMWTSTVGQTPRLHRLFCCLVVFRVRAS